MFNSEQNSNLMNYEVVCSEAKSKTTAYTQVSFTVSEAIKSGLLIVSTGSASTNSIISSVDINGEILIEIFSNKYTDSASNATTIMHVYKVENVSSGSTLNINGTALFNGMYTILG